MKRPRQSRLVNCLGRSDHQPDGYYPAVEHVPRCAQQTHEHAAADHGHRRGGQHDPEPRHLMSGVVHRRDPFLWASGAAQLHSRADHDQQRLADAWRELVDSGLGNAKGLPFNIDGEVVPVEL